MTKDIYLDANATTSVLPAAAAAARHVMRTLFGNPSSTHCTGLQAKDLMATVRTRAARLLGTGDGRLVFVSGATEAIQTAVLSALCAIRERRQLGGKPGGLLLYGATEHKAVPESLAHWNHLLGLNLELRALPVDIDGQHDLNALRAVAADAALVCTMAANNETGVVSDLAAIESVLKQTNSDALWLVDCVQALGKLALDLAATRIDYAAFSGHKLYAPKGIGMLYTRAKAPFTPLMAGGGQESGQRSGTENMAGIAALGAVLEALEDGRTFRTHGELVVFRERLAQSLREALPGIVFNAPFAKALPTTLNFSVPGFSSKELLDLFDAAGIRVSSGSACSAAKAQPSFVLEAMGLPAWQAASAIRMSFGLATDEAFLNLACDRIKSCGAALRASGLAPSDLRAAAIDGVVQLAADGTSTWLLLDSPSRSCVVVDPLPELVPRVQGTIRHLDYRVLAVLSTSADAAHASARNTLLQSLPGDMGEQSAIHRESGWPSYCSSITLADGSQAGALVFGRQMLAHLEQQGHHVYLLGQAAGRLMAADAVQFAFFTPSSPLPALGHFVNPRTVLCPARDPQGLLVTTLQADHSSAAQALDKDMHLCAKTIGDFLREHTDALLVDVREPFEHLAGAPPTWTGHATLHVPLSRLANHMGIWLRGKPRPLVFVCRSGNRSGKAASCLRRLGYRQAWHLAGGLALAGGMAE